MVLRWGLLSFQYCISFTKITVFVTTDVPVFLTITYTKFPPSRMTSWPRHRGIPHLARFMDQPLRTRSRSQEVIGQTLTHTFYLDDWDSRIPLYIWIRAPTQMYLPVSSYGPFAIPPYPDYYFRPVFLEQWTS